MDTQSGVAEAFLGGFEQTSSITEEEAQERIDLLVTLEDEKWNDVLQEFQRLFADPDMSIGRILSDKFTTHEARLFIPSELAVLKAIQEENTRDFHTLLESQRFQGITPDIPTKLTMLYFGLHVEPMDFQLAKMTFKLESRKPEPPRYAIDPPLHFLTAHKERNWGKEMLRGKEDPTYPIPVELPQSWLSSLSNTFLTEQDSQIEQPTVRLRGGGTSNDSDWGKENTDWNDENDDDFAGSESNGEDGNEDSDYDDNTPEDQLHREEKEAEDATMENTEIDGDFISHRQSAITPQNSIGMNLYGFQGYVPFIPGDGQTYEDAIRRLLSLGPQDHKAFYIVHFDVKSKRVVDTIHDSLPLNPVSITLQYILEKKLEEDSFSDNLHSFFVHLEHESTPTHWQPSEEELYTSVSSVRSLLDGTEDQVARVVDSCCYLTFPTFKDSQPSQEDVYGWGADQLNAYLNTAFEVLFGRPQDSFHHANFQLSGLGLDSTNAPSVYGPYTTPSSAVFSLIPNGDGDGKHLYLSRRPLGNNNVPIVLPGCFKISNSTSDRVGKIPLTDVLDFMRNIISSAFDDYAKNLKYVRLLDGRATLGPEIRRDQEYLSICMSDDIPQNSEIDYSAALSKIAETPRPFVILCPEWEEDENVLHLSTSDGEDGTEHSVHMPSLSSTVDDLRTSVFELMQLAECEPSRIEDVKRGDAFISVQPEMENESSDIIDMPCFFIGPNTTDEEWFSIRARIPTPSAKIKILDSKAWNWRNQVDKTNIWGPRYGRMAGVQAAIEKSEDEDAREQEEEEAPQDGVEETAHEAFQTPVRDSSVGVEAVRAQLRQTELVRVTHVEPAKTQRLGRDASGDSDVRQRSWLHQPSVYDNCGSCSQSNYSDIQIPTNAPSFEPMLRTGSEMPEISTAFMTLTEQARLRRGFSELRNILLNRKPLLHDGSRVSDQQTMKKYSEFLRMARKCTFCNRIIPKHWSKERVHRHLRVEHRNELMEALGVTKATIRRFDGKGVISIPLKRVERRRNPSPVALANDDMVVDQPEAQDHHKKKASEFCDRCGDDGNNCESDTSHPAQDERDQIRTSCKESNPERGRYCRYCGDEFSGNAGQADWDRNADHMAACYKKNDGQKSLFLPPDVAAFNQQQDNLRMQINEAETGAIDSHEEEELPSIETIFRAADPEAEQNPEEMDLDESDGEPRRRKPAKRRQMGRSGEESTDPSMDGTGNRALEQAVNRALIGYETPSIEALDPDAHQEALPAALERVLAHIPLDELDVSSPSMTQTRAPSQPANSDQLVAESEKEPEVSQPQTQKMTESPEPEDPQSSESGPDNGSDFENEPDQDKSDDEESEDDPQGDPSSSKRHKRGGKKRGKKGDRNYRYSGDEDDDEDSETDEDGNRTRLPRRAPSPNWQRKLGDDPEFEPTDDYYCSKCFRKAPKKHKRDRSPLGRTKEIELHYDKNRCCGIRRGIGSARRLPNRSGWIPSAEMPKPLGNLRKQFLRRYPAYSRTLYPLNASNANGSYWRSDPNNDENKGCWDIPWPPFRGKAPLPDGWEAPDELNVAVAGKARKQFKLRAVGDSTYVEDKNAQDSDDEEIASDKDVNGKRKRKSRPSSAVNSRHATPTPGKTPQKPDAKAEKAATPRPVKKKETVLKKVLKGKAARPRKAVQKKTERKEPTRRSARKRQKTG